jgi:hypothetical protein
MYLGFRVICEVTLSSPCLWGLLSPPISSLTQWYLQSNEILLNLSLKCTRFESNNSSCCTGRSCENMCSKEWRRSGKKRKDRMKLSWPPKLVGGKLVWVPVISFCKIFIPSYVFDALLYWNWPFSAPNRMFLRITLLFIHRTFFWFFVPTEF